MKHKEILQEVLAAEVKKWESKSLDEIRRLLLTDPLTYSLEHQGILVDVEVIKLEESDKSMHVAIAVSTPRSLLSCFSPLSNSVIVHAGD